MKKLRVLLCSLIVETKSCCCFSGFFEWESTLFFQNRIKHAHIVAA